jgi:hypothetical protein
MTPTKFTLKGPSGRREGIGSQAYTGDRRRVRQERTSVTGVQGLVRPQSASIQDRAPKIFGRN